MNAPDLRALAGRPVIIGAGLAGLMTALELAPTLCVLVTGSTLGADCASDLAQGGLAAAIGVDDNPSLHAADTIAAGAGLCDPAVVERITRAGPESVATMLGLGARLDRSADGSLRLGLEGAHVRRRIVHADGDGTGHEMTRAAVAAVRASPSITVLEHAYAVRLTTTGAAVTGVWLAVPRTAGTREFGVEGTETLVHLSSDRVVLATGGLGGLYGHTTNPRGARGSGLALGLRAGAVAQDLEMVQFHPTALDVGLDPMPLVTEAVRGEGAVLVTLDGVRILSDALAARDIVSRAVWAQLEAGALVYLDAREAIGTRFPRLFPTVTAACRAAGIDPVGDLIPVRPAAHYAMGGLLVDDECRTTVPGLWAVGEVSSTGLHGANRLASNSLLEAIVCAGWAARSVRSAGRTNGQATPPAAPERIPHEPSGWAPDPLARETLTRHAGVLRDRNGLAQAIGTLAPDALACDARLVSTLLCVAAVRRTESRGGHWRTDLPAGAIPEPAAHTLVSIADCAVEALAAEVERARAPERRVERPDPTLHLAEPALSATATPSATPVRSAS
ncbi:MAG: L-aspartate oxidase [Micrococcales bacterium]|nr:L-aspartate oxidase [Micrococcales bacterium]